jgi:beta-glucosidase
MRYLALCAASLAIAAAVPTFTGAQPESLSARAWMDPARPVDERVAALLKEMTVDEKLTLIFGQFATDFPPKKFTAPAGAREGSAGYVPGVPRLGIPAQWQADAGIGVATQGGAKRKRERTALPSGLATAATWNPELAHRGGAMIGAEAHASGFNVLLGGGVNLIREPRNGRNFEYAGEDPLLAGTMAGAQIAGVQSQHVISTTKHFALNDQETDRNAGNAVIDEKAAHLSDLLAFEIGLEKGEPGAVMCAYNRVNGPFSCESPWLLTRVLRQDWGFKGFVMSDWGGTHSTDGASAAGLDQQSGYPFDIKPFFGEDMRKALADGRIPAARLDTMVSRILYAMVRHGIFDHPVTGAPHDLPADMMARDGAVSRADAAEAMVLLKNERDLLPLAARAKRIVVIGGHADKGVLAGGGSSLVYPRGGNAVPGLQPAYWPGPIMYYPSSPLEALKRRLPGATISFVDGSDPAQAAAQARGADMAIVFATQWAGEAFDVSLTLADDQDALIQAVAAANPRTAVVLETGGPVLTPWASRVGAIVAAWYPGTEGGEAIADVLTGRVNPSGHLPVTFPASLDQLPHPQAPGKGEFRYTEGATVGYKWFEAKGLTPAFPFGHGLSYTRFRYVGFSVTPSGGVVTARFKVANTGRRPGQAVAQVYAGASGWEAPRRLAGFGKVALAPGETRTLTVALDPRTLSDYDVVGRCWRPSTTPIRLALGDSSARPAAETTLTIRAGTLKGTRLCHS